MERLAQTIKKMGAVLPRIYPSRPPRSPQSEYGSLFDAILLSQVIEDNKSFVDALPKKAPRDIRRAYAAAERDPKFSMAAFLEEHFLLPKNSEESQDLIETSEIVTDAREHIETMWDVLTREPDTQQPHSSLLPLPYPYVVPGGRFRELYYWDSYFTMIGLKESGRNDMVEYMVRNFAHLIQTYGFVPNGNRTYYLTRSQPPIFALAVTLLASIRGEHTYATFLPQLEKEYTFWMRGTQLVTLLSGSYPAYARVVRMPGGEILNRYYDDLDTPREEMFAEDVALVAETKQAKGVFRNIRAASESGWDYSSRWFKDGRTFSTIQTTNVVPVDLNCLLLELERTLARASRIAGLEKRAQHYEQVAAKRAHAIRRYFWNEGEAWFYDYLNIEKTQSTEKTLAGVFPLWMNVATGEQAAKVKDTLVTDFVRPGGLVTSLVNSGQQWDAPNGWAPLQYAALRGLEKYGYSDEARDIAERWCTLCIDEYTKTGAFFEKYNVEAHDLRAGGGEYAVQTGFGWTNGVLLYCMNRYMHDTPLAKRFTET